MFIPDPDFCPSRIPDPRPQVKKKLWAIYMELYKFLPKKLPLSSQKYGLGVRDPEKKPILDPASRGQKGTGSRIRKTVKRRVYCY
jgi:hypothetical protein